MRVVDIFPKKVLGFLTKRIHLSASNLHFPLRLPLLRLLPLLWLPRFGPGHACARGPRGPWRRPGRSTAGCSGHDRAGGAATGSTTGGGEEPQPQPPEPPEDRDGVGRTGEKDEGTKVLAYAGHFGVERRF